MRWSSSTKTHRRPCWGSCAQTSSSRAATTSSPQCRRPNWSGRGAARRSSCPTWTVTRRPACWRRQAAVPAEERRPGRVLVTGGASGLGYAVAAAVAEAGGRPYVLDLREPPLQVEHAKVDLADRL